MIMTDEKLRFINHICKLQDENSLLQRKITFQQKIIERYQKDAEFNQRLIAASR